MDVPVPELAHDWPDLFILVFISSAVWRRFGALVPGGPEIHREKIPGSRASKKDISPSEIVEETVAEGHSEAGRRQLCALVTKDFNSALFF